MPSTLPTELTTTMVAAELGLSRFTVLTYTYRNMLEARRVGRISIVTRAALERFKREYPHLVKRAA